MKDLLEKAKSLRINAQDHLEKGYYMCIYKLIITNASYFIPENIKRVGIYLSEHYKLWGLNSPHF